MLRRKIISLVKLSFHIANAMERRSRSKERFVFVIRILILDIVCDLDFVIWKFR